MSETNSRLSSASKLSSDLESVELDPSGLSSSRLGEQSLVLSWLAQGDGTGMGPDLPPLELPTPSRSSALKLEPRRRRPITLFISFVALDGVVRMLSDLPT